MPGRWGAQGTVQEPFHLCLATASADWTQLCTHHTLCLKMSSWGWFILFSQYASENFSIWLLPLTQGMLGNLVLHCSACICHWTLTTDNEKNWFWWMTAFFFFFNHVTLPYHIFLKSRHPSLSPIPEYSPLKIKATISTKKRDQQSFLYTLNSQLGHAGIGKCWTSI